MPLFYQQNIDDSTQLALWKIEEPESFFLERVTPQREVSHPYKRLQHLAGRYLLTILAEDFPLASITINQSRKPYLEGHPYYFSISHCGNYAAAIVSTSRSVGIDIEYKTPRLYNIMPKFLNDYEQDFLKEWEDLTAMHLQMITLLWSAKEAIYKWYGEGGVDFKSDMLLSGPMVIRADEEVQMPFLFTKKTPPSHLTIEARIFDGLVMAWT